MQLGYNTNTIVDHIYEDSFLRDTFAELMAEFEAAIKDKVEDEMFNEGLLKATSGSLLKLLNYELEIDDDEYSEIDC